METLPVIFRAERSGPHKGEVTAVFPTLPWDNRGALTTYAHVGQHGPGSVGWYWNTRPARPAEYAPLLAELRALYTTRPQSNPSTYGEPVTLMVRQGLYE